MGTYDPKELLKMWKRSPQEITDKQAMGQSLQLHVEHDEQLEEHKLEFIRIRNEVTKQINEAKGRINKARAENRDEINRSRALLRDLKPELGTFKEMGQQFNDQLSQFQEATEQQLADLTSRVEAIEESALNLTMPTEKVFHVDGAFLSIFETGNHMTFALTMALQGEEKRVPPPQQEPPSSDEEDKSDA